MQDHQRVAPVAIIGAGFSGTMAAVQLARRGIKVVLVGRGDQAGKGVAYSTEDPAHLLNIPAAKMSAWPDQPDDFVEAVADEGFGPEDYVPRHLFGRYLRNILDQAAVTLVEGEAIAVQPTGEGWTVRLGTTARSTPRRWCWRRATSRPTRCRMRRACPNVCSPAIRGARRGGRRSPKRWPGAATC